MTPSAPSSMAMRERRIDTSVLTALAPTTTLVRVPWHSSTVIRLMVRSSSSLTTKNSPLVPVVMIPSTPIRTSFRML